MTENTAHNEDLSLDTSESEAVAGGSSRARTEMDKLKSQGYEEGECTSEGTMMVNPKTHQHKMVKY